jgi:hypothetical protein
VAAVTTAVPGYAAGPARRLAMRLATVDTARTENTAAGA